MFMLAKKYKRGCDFKRRVLEDPQKELRELYNAGQCDLYFEFEPKSYKGKEAVSYTHLDVYKRQELAAHEAGYKTECVFTSEIKKHAIKVLCTVGSFPTAGWAVQGAEKTVCRGIWPQGCELFHERMYF